MSTNFRFIEVILPDTTIVESLKATRARRGGRRSHAFQSPRDPGRDRRATLLLGDNLLHRLAKLLETHTHIDIATAWAWCGEHLELLETESTRRGLGVRASQQAATATLRNRCPSRIRPLSHLIRHETIRAWNVRSHETIRDSTGAHPAGGPAATAAPAARGRRGLPRHVAGHPLQRGADRGRARPLLAAPAAVDRHAAGGAVRAAACRPGPLHAVEGAARLRRRRLQAQPAPRAAARGLQPARAVGALPAGTAQLPVPDRPPRAAQRHLAALGPGDLVVYDRGYYSFELLRAHSERQVEAVFRLQRNASGQVREFVAGSSVDEVVSVQPSETARCRLPAAELADLYHGRWSVEELYKISKELLGIESFHGRSERTVKQELWAHFTLIAMARLFASRCERQFESRAGEAGRPPLRANFSHSLGAVERELEALLLQAPQLRDTLNRVLEHTAQGPQRERPGRSYPRRSRRPSKKWRKRKSADPQTAD